MSMTAAVATEGQTDSLHAESMTPYRLINLLLNGALERIEQAMGRITEGEIDEAVVLLEKTIGIVNELRESLDLNQGGEIADNLNVIYEYVLSRLVTIETETSITTLTEIKNLLQEVQSGWLGIADNVNEKGELPLI